MMVPKMVKVASTISTGVHFLAFRWGRVLCRRVSSFIRGTRVCYAVEVPPV